MTVHDVKISTKCPVQNPKSIEICRIGGEIYVYMDVHKGIWEVYPVSIVYCLRRH